MIPGRFSQKVFPGLPSLSPWLLFPPHKTSKTLRMCLCTPPPHQNSAFWELSWGFMRPGRPEALIRHLLNETPAQSQPKGAPDGDNQKGDQPFAGWAVGLSSKQPHWSKPFLQFPGSGAEPVTQPPLSFPWVSCHRREIHSEKSENNLHIYHYTIRKTEGPAKGRAVLRTKMTACAS